MLTLGVVKNIIPAVASTNAIVAAACSHECIKVLSYIAPSVENYMMYMGKTGVNISTFEMQSNPKCYICCSAAIDYPLKKTVRVDELVQKMEKEFNVRQVTINSESGVYLYAANPPALYESNKHKMEMTLG